MPTRSSLAICLLAVTTFLRAIQAHTVLTYPGWRGDNLFSNGTVEDTGGLSSFAVDNGTLHPFGMQWEYPCGGMPMSQNRTKWPVQGGAIAFQPGWFSGHSSAFLYFNLGIGNNPANYSFVMQNGLNIVGPSKEPWPGTFCLPQVPLPAGLQVNVGDNATIQIIETALHGAALYNCVDITFAEPEEVEEVNEQNCFNSTQLSSNLIFTTEALASDSAMANVPLVAMLTMAAAAMFALI
ncbi:hypothetical protein LTR70_008474 [Exophiala xenobiotica]|uniref:Copper acquisition factor BIM1-like domain-containing protein n=1 Tax=Lithohypha guttulata TaxID=1690604 RepID=A0ABR0K0Z0_9EURO|nr:hypothetical protein LTR24_008107 [Lithohypha guttulata]KAK5311973.1 hypothetical protein LTR70_008474 [Exophiala xenobiotica]